jgi:hypothetical protein
MGEFAKKIDGLKSTSWRVEDKYFLFVIDILIQFELQTHIATFWQKDRQKKSCFV